MAFRPEVFLSATPVEMDGYREVVRKVLRDMGAQVVEHTDYTVAYGPLQGVLYQEIQRCEVVIHLAGKQYGLEPGERTLGAPKRSFAHYELDVARSLGKPIFCFLTTPQTPTPAMPPEDDERRLLQTEHRQALQRGGEGCHEFTDAEDLARLIRALRQRIMVRRSLVRIPRKPMGDKLQGRRQLMETLRKEVERGGVIVLHLPNDDDVTAGTGRTTLAMELGWQLYDERRFPYVIALPGGPKADLEVALAALARSDALGLLPDEVAGHRARFDAVVEWFSRPENAGRWLLILDGVEDAANWVRVKSIVSSLGQGTVLVTSRIRQWSDARAIAVGRWGPEPASEYLLGRALGGKSPSRSDFAAAERLTEGLGRLPLALEVLAAHLCNARQTPSEFLGGLEEDAQHNGDELLAPVTIAFPELLKRVTARLDAFARALLFQIVCVSPQPASIPLAIFEQRADWAQIRVALMQLEALALIEMDESGRAVWMHRTIRETLYGQLGEDDHKAALTSAVSNIDTALRRSSNNLVLRETLIPHCRALIWQLHGHALESIAAPLDQTYARWLQDSGRAAEADPYFRWALHIDAQRLGADHPEIIHRLRDMVTVLRIRGRVWEAIAFARRALEATERMSGKDHPDVVGDLYNVAGCLRAANELDEAEQLYRRALQIEERHTSPTHPRVAVALHRLAGSLEVAGRLLEADALYRRALSIDERAFAPGHPRVITGLHNRAGILTSLRRYDEAEELLRRALAADEKTYGSAHLEIAPALKLLATLVAQREHFAEAEGFLRRALEIDETALGLDHAEVAADVASLSSLLLTTGQLDEARQLAERAVKSYLRLGKALRREHPHLRSALALLADIKRAQGRGDDEISPQERTLLGEGQPKRVRPVIEPAKPRP